MRKIQFNKETIEQIRKYVVNEQHTVEETCNRFTLKSDTLRRVLFENNIRPVSHNHNKTINAIYTYNDIPETKINEICRLFSCTKATINDICKQVKLTNYAVQVVINKHFTQQERDTRKSALYRECKLGVKNPMLGKTGQKHHNYKGLVEDGNGYYMIRKPDWYSSRKKSAYIFYHHYVLCKALSWNCIPAGYVVHHIDYNKKNNNINNLALMTISAHARLHTVELKIQGAETIHKEVEFNNSKS